MDIDNLHKLFLECNSISIDTRKIIPNSMFCALKGNNFDANSFAQSALEKKAKYVIIDNEDFYVDNRTILVNDSLETLQQLAKFHRNYLKVPIIALTGSNGKTTTKELINCVLSEKYKTSATIGNLNNHIGVPLTLLSFTEETEIGIVEMGANHQKEIEFLCEIAQPNFGLITNFGKAHLEGFGGIEGVIIGKSEIYNYLFDNNKIAFVNLDDKLQVEKSNNLEKITFGLKNPIANLNILSITANPLVTIEYENNSIHSKLIGLYNSNNINNAVLIGKYFKVSDLEIKNAIENYIPENNRSQLLIKNSNEIILDAYNANPSSMKVAIDNFLQLKKQNKIIILGDMFELGSESNFEHQIIINSLIKNNGIACYFIGKYFFECKIKNENLSFFETFNDFSLFLNDQKPKNSFILIKGSRGMALEKTLDLI